MWTYDANANAFERIEDNTVVVRVSGNDENISTMIPDHDAVKLAGLMVKATIDAGVLMLQKDATTIEHLGYSWKSTYEAAGAFNGAVQLAQISGENTCFLVDVNGDSYEVAVADALEIARLAGTAYRARYLGYTAKLREIATAQTLESLAAITIDW